MRGNKQLKPVKVGDKLVGNKQVADCVSAGVAYAKSPRSQCMVFTKYPLGGKGGGFGCRFTDYGKLPSHKGNLATAEDADLLKSFKAFNTR